MNKEKRSIVFTVLIFIASIIFIIGMGKLIYDDTWPQKFSQEEEEYYKEIVSKAWNEGLKSISEQIDTNNELISVYSQGTETVAISFNVIQKNKIIVESSKKGRLTFDFNDSEISTKYKRNSYFLSVIVVIMGPIVIYCMLAIFCGILHATVKDLIKSRKVKKEINLRDYSEGIDYTVDKKGL